MKNIFAVILFFIAAPTLAYEPEALLAKAITPVSHIESPGSYQFLNPFSKVGISITQLDLDKKDDREFSLNLSPKGIGEAVHYKHLNTSIAADIAVSGKLTKSQSLQTAYSALIAAALAKEQNASSRQIRDLLEKTQKLSSLEARLNRADAKNVLKANSDMQKSLNEMIDSEAQIAGIKKFLLDKGLNLESLETTDLLSADEILARLDKIPNVKTALTTQKLLTEIDVSRNDAKHAMAQRNKLLDGVKFSLRKEKKEDTLRLEVGFNLPFLASQNMDDYKDSLKIAESDAKIQQSLLEESQRSAGLLELLRQKISLYHTMGNFPELKSQALLRQDPALALDLERTSVALRLTKASLLAEIRNLYIALLLEAEILAGDPNLNHLSRTGRKI